jgi:hypothetical protein
MIRLLSLLFCALLFLSGPALAAGPGADTELQLGSDVRQLDESLCALKVLPTLPLISIPVSSFALDQITLQQGPQHQIYTVTVPLKQVQDKIKTVVWHSKTLDDAVLFIQLLEDGRLKAVSVESRATAFHAKAEQLGDSLLESCRHLEGRTKELRLLVDMLERCNDCRIRELVFSQTGSKQGSGNLPSGR